MEAKKKFHCMELFRFPAEALRLPLEERMQVLEALIKSRDDPFPPNALAAKAPIGWMDEAIVCSLLFFCLGGPFLWIFFGILCLCTGSWTAVVSFLTAHMFLAFHPLPSSDWLSRSKLSLLFYRYFSYRYVWSGEARERVKTCAPWIGASPPHGAMPFANLLCLPGINACTRTFSGGAATVVFRTPFLRYLTLAGPCHTASSGDIMESISNGRCVGLAPDGIAGIFRCTSTDETVYLKERKGVAKLSLRTGTPLVPAFSFGNTDCFSCVYDPFGIMESLSRKAQASIFVFYGRFGLTIPRRVNISMVFGNPIEPPKSKAENIKQEDIDKLHSELLTAIESNYNEWKDALGYGHKVIKFV